MIAAHRGATDAGQLENTLPAFEAAITHGAHCIELDIRACRDGTLIVRHDPDIDGHSLADLSWPELQSLALTQDVQLSTLEEVLQQVGTRIFLDLEIKVAGIEADVLKLAADFCTPKQYVVTSFLDTVVEAVKALEPSVRAGLILGKANPSPWLSTRLSELFPARRLRACNADFVVPHYRLLRFFYLNRMKRGGWPVWVWTINENSVLKRLIDRPEIETIITDRCAIALNLWETRRSPCKSSVQFLSDEDKSRHDASSHRSE